MEIIIYVGRCPMDLANSSKYFSMNETKNKQGELTHVSFIIICN